MQANRGVALILLGLMTRLVSPRPVLRLHPNWPLVFAGETVRLRCFGQKGVLRGFKWYKTTPQPWTQVYRTSDYFNHTYTISSVTEAHSGSYKCTDFYFYSDDVKLSVSALPKATLTVESKWNPLYIGETITLKCEVDYFSNWTYFWYKDQLQTAISLTKQYNVTITGDAGSEQGQYWCEGRLEGRNVTSQRSDSISLTVAGRLVFGLGTIPLVFASIVLCVKWLRRPDALNEAAVRPTEENITRRLVNSPHRSHLRGMRNM